MHGKKRSKVAQILRAELNAKPFSNAQIICQLFTNEVTQVQISLS
jgi:hypothetical protein